MDATELLEPVLDGGIVHPHYFNGRILSAEALRSADAANARQHRQIARAIGAGIAFGFRVRRAATSNREPPTLHITTGLAFGTLGEALAMASDIDLALVRTADIPSSEAGAFAECEPPSTPLFTNFGLYLLTVLPAAGFSGMAPMVEPLESGIAGSCGRANTIEGVKFRVRELAVTALAASPLQAELAVLLQRVETQIGTDPATVTPEMFRYRSIAAHLFLASDRWVEPAADPFPVTPTGPLTPLDALRARAVDPLLSCEVPLALLHWSRRGIEFIDEWAVRRALVPLATDDPASFAEAGALAFADGPRRRAEAMARIFQFQAQLADILQVRGDAELSALRAADYFRYLPSAGLVPLAGRGFRGFAAEAFFDGRPFRPLEPLAGRTNRTAEFIAGAALPALFADALNHPPLDLVAGADGAEMVWLMSVVENQRAIDAGTGRAAYVAFAAPHVSPPPAARFDIARFDFSNFADCACSAVYRPQSRAQE